jgi:hypothetical protein
MAQIVKLSEDHAFFPEITQILTRLEAKFPNLTPIGFWLGIPTKGIARCEFTKVKNTWKCNTLTVYYEFSEFWVVNMPQLTITHYGKSKPLITPVDQFNEIEVDGKILKWQLDKDLLREFNRVFKKRHHGWVKNAGIRPMIYALSNEKPFYFGVSKFGYPRSLYSRDLSQQLVEAVYSA